MFHLICHRTQNSARPGHFECEPVTSHPSKLGWGTPILIFEIGHLWDNLQAAGQLRLSTSKAQGVGPTRLLASFTQRMSRRTSSSPRKVSSHRLVIPAEALIPPGCHSRGSGNPSYMINILDSRFRGSDMYSFGENDGCDFRGSDRYNFRGRDIFLCLAPELPKSYIDMHPKTRRPL